MAEYIKASLLGCAIGDAYGGAFARSEMPMRGTFWTVSSDSQQLFATCAAISSDGEVSPEKIAAGLLAWHKKGLLFNPGPATLMALVEMSAGAKWNETGQRGEVSLSNESITRLAPLAFLVDPATAKGQEKIKEICRITHQGDQAYEGALAVILAIRFIRNDQQNFIQQVIRFLPDSHLKDRLLAISKKPGITIRETGRTFGASGNIVDSIPLAMFAARLVPELGFAQMMKEIVSAGGEMRSNCAIAGLIAGHWAGMNAIPQEMLDKLKTVKDYEKFHSIALDFSEKVDGMQGVQKLF